MVLVYAAPGYIGLAWNRSIPIRCDEVSGTVGPESGLQVYLSVAVVYFYWQVSTLLSPVVMSMGDTCMR